MKERGLVVLHIDGLGYDRLLDAVASGRMPFTASLLQRDYMAQAYRCGVPSTTPYCQAGILYGDNTDIPGFRWYDKRLGAPIRFGAGSTFEKVADRYFHGAEPLARDGACIAAIYPAGAAERFGLTYGRRNYRGGDRSRSAGHVIGRFFLKPPHVADFFGHAGKAIGSIAAAYTTRRLQGHHPAGVYAGTDIVDEIFLHHLTRFAVRQAIAEGHPVIYAGFYAYDETGHAFGPDDDLTENMLRDVDRSFELIARRADEVRSGGRDYEIVAVSDHGQIAMIPLDRVAGVSLAEAVGALAPAYQVIEIGRKRIPDLEAGKRGRIAIAASGGLAHLYFVDRPGRLDRGAIEAEVPGLIAGLARQRGVAFLLLHDAEGDRVVDAAGEVPLPDAGEMLAQFDRPEILVKQLAKLNSFPSGGDLKVVAAFHQGRQVNFEKQAGGHGSIGGEQLHPFVLSRAGLGLDTSVITDAAELHAPLVALRDELWARPVAST